jgi:hypothetical protein
VQKPVVELAHVPFVLDGRAAAVGPVRVVVIGVSLAAPRSVTPSMS